MNELEPVERWVLACRTRNGGPWHIHFSSMIYHDYESAARQAFAFNEGLGVGYESAPLRVLISPVDAQHE